MRAVARSLEADAVPGAEFPRLVARARVRRSAVHKVLVPFAAVASSVLADAVAGARSVLPFWALDARFARFPDPSRVAVAVRSGFLADAVAVAAVGAQAVRGPRAVGAIPPGAALALALDALALLGTVAVVRARARGGARRALKALVALAKPAVALAMETADAAIVLRALARLSARGALPPLGAPARAVLAHAVLVAGVFARRVRSEERRVGEEGGLAG